MSAIFDSTLILMVAADFSWHLLLIVILLVRILLAIIPVYCFLHLIIYFTRRYCVSGEIPQYDLKLLPLCPVALRHGAIEN